MFIWNLTVIVMMGISASSLTTLKRYQGWYGDHIGSFFDIESESSVPDRIICEWQCVKKRDCYGVTFINADFSCRQMPAMRILSYNGDPDSGISIVKWQKVYMVWDSMVRGSQISTWTQDEARALCEKLGFRLITHRELDVAMGTGNYNYNDCGYVEGGVTHMDNTTCNLNGAHAFCLNP